MASIGRTIVLYIFVQDYIVFSCFNQFVFWCLQHELILAGLVVGGVDISSSSAAVNTVEVYTPGQTCQKTLAPMPLPSSNPILALMSGKYFTYVTVK
jgi:hypothetical protein